METMRRHIAFWVLPVGSLSPSFIEHQIFRVPKILNPWMKPKPRQKGNPGAISIVCVEMEALKSVGVLLT
jgi:hypothetical protein